MALYRCLFPLLPAVGMDAPSHELTSGIAATASPCSNAASTRGTRCSRTSRTPTRAARRCAHLVYVPSIDFMYGDENLARSIAATRQAAEDVGCELVLLETNLRHFTERFQHWGFTFGGGLAGMALALGAGFSHVLLPGTFPINVTSISGSHPVIDPLWSTERTAIVHDGAEATRVDKARLLADHPEALRNLKVCFEADTTQNCGRCDKSASCTMMDLQAAGVLEESPSSSARWIPAPSRGSPTHDCGLRSSNRSTSSGTSRSTSSRSGSPWTRPCSRRAAYVRAAGPSSRPHAPRARPNRAHVPAAGATPPGDSERLALPSWITDASTVLDVTALLAAVATIVTALELIRASRRISKIRAVRPTEYIAHDELECPHQAPDTCVVPRRAGVQLIFAVLVVLCIALDVSPALPLVVLAITTVLRTYLLRYGGEGADHMAQVVTISAAIAFVFSGNATVGEIALVFIAAQLCLALWRFGCSEAVRAQRGGRELRWQGVLHTAFGRTGIVRSSLDRRPGAGRLLSWAVIGLEILFPVGILLGGWAALGTLATIATLQLERYAVLMGLNRFVLWFFATFPRRLGLRATTAFCPRERLPIERVPTRTGGHQLLVVGPLALDDPELNQPRTGLTKLGRDHIQEPEIGHGHRSASETSDPGSPP